MGKESKNEKSFSSPFSRFAKIISLTNEGYGQAGGGFTEHEWFGKNLSIMPVLNQYILIALSF